MDNIVRVAVSGLLIFSFFACRGKTKENKISLTPANNSSQIDDIKKTPGYLTNFNSYTLSQAEKVFVKPAGLKADGAVYLGVDSSSVTFIFGLNRCEYSFPCVNEDHKIKLKWNLDRGECDYKNFLSETFGLKTYPKKNDIFAEIEPSGDSALRVTYLFTDFIEKQNRKARENKEFTIDTIFPATFRLHN